MLASRLRRRSESEICFTFASLHLPSSVHLHGATVACKCMCVCGMRASFVRFVQFLRQTGNTQPQEGMFFLWHTHHYVFVCVCCVFVYIGLLSLCLSAFDSPLLMCFSLCALLVCACVCATTKYTKTHMRHKRTRTLTTIIKANTFSAVQVLFLRRERLILHSSNHSCVYKAQILLMFYALRSASYELCV